MYRAGSEQYIESKIRRLFRRGEANFGNLRLVRRWEEVWAYSYAMPLGVMFPRGDVLCMEAYDGSSPSITTTSHMQRLTDLAAFVARAMGLRPPNPREAHSAFSIAVRAPVLQMGYREASLRPLTHLLPEGYYPPMGERLLGLLGQFTVSVADEEWLAREAGAVISRGWRGEGVHEVVSEALSLRLRLPEELRAGPALALASGFCGSMRAPNPAELTGEIVATPRVSLEIAGRRVKARIGWLPQLSPRHIWRSFALDDKNAGLLEVLLEGDAEERFWAALAIQMGRMGGIDREDLARRYYGAWVGAL